MPSIFFRAWAAGVPPVFAGRLASGGYGPGEHTVGVDAVRLVPGLYLARLDAAGPSETQRFVVVR